MKTPPFIDVKDGYLGEYAHFCRFHTEVLVIAFECANGCCNMYGTPERWVVPLGDPEDNETEGRVRGGVLGRFVLCPNCGTYNVKFLMVYPTVPKERRYWFWDMGTYEKLNGTRQKASRTSEARPQSNGETVA